MITRIPKWAGNDVLEELTEEPPLQQRLQEAARRFFEKAGSSDQKTTADSTSDAPNRWDRYKRPITSTGLADNQPPKH
jgi:hypothetical protein